MKTLNDIQKGDTMEYHGLTKAFEVTVVKCTPKTITVSTGVPQRFMRATGLKIGCERARPFIKPLDEPTP